MPSHHVICSYETPCCQLTALNVCLGLQFISRPKSIIVSLGCFKHKIDELNTAIRLRFTTRESTCVSPTKVDKPDFESWFPQNKTGSKMTCTICPVNIYIYIGHKWPIILPNSCWCIVEKNDGNVDGLPSLSLHLECRVSTESMWPLPTKSMYQGVVAQKPWSYQCIWRRPTTKQM